MNIENLADEEILEIVNPIMDNLMEASTAIDYKRHIRDFTPRLKNILSADFFKEICKAYQGEKGFFSTRKLAGIYRRPGAVAVIWTQGFTKIEGNFIAEILVIQQGDSFLVDHVMAW